MSDESNKIPLFWIEATDVKVSLSTAGHLQLVFHVVPAPGANPTMMGYQLPPQALQKLQALLDKAGVAQNTLSAPLPRSGAH